MNRAKAFIIGLTGYLIPMVIGMAISYHYVSELIVYSLPFYFGLIIYGIINMKIYKEKEDFFVFDVLSSTFWYNLFLHYVMNAYDIFQMPHIIQEFVLFIVMPIAMAIYWDFVIKPLNHECIIRRISKSLSMKRKKRR